MGLDGMGLELERDEGREFERGYVRLR